MNCYKIAVTVLAFCFLTGVCYADSYEDAGYAIGRQIAQNLAKDEAHVVTTSEYKNDSYNAGKIKKVFVMSVVPQGFEQFVADGNAIARTNQMVVKIMQKKGFQAESMDDVITKISQEQNINLKKILQNDTSQGWKIIMDYVNSHYDAICGIKIMTYRMIPGQASNRAEATLDITISDPKLDVTVYSYTRQYIRANLLLAPNSPIDMVKKISNIFVAHFSDKVKKDSK